MGKYRPKRVVTMSEITTMMDSESLQPANNLSDLDSASEARDNLELGTAATHATGDYDAAGVAATAAAAAQAAAIAASNQRASNLSDVAVPATARANIGANHYDIDMFIVAAPGASLQLKRFVAPRSITLPVDLAGSVAKAGTAATAQTDFDIQVQGVSKGTIRFAAAGTTATFIFAAPVTIAAGEVLTVVAPGTPDITLAQIAITLAGTY